jgi:hypothetical protein
MSDIDQALSYIFSNTAPDGAFRAEALELHKMLQHRKQLRDKKHRQDYRFFKKEMIEKSTIKKNRNLYSYGKAI